MELPIYKLHEQGVLEKINSITIPFVKGGDEPTNGVISEDMIDALIERLKILNSGKFNNRFTDDAIYHLRKASDALRERKVERQSRNVYGTQLPLMSSNTHLEK